jgi:multicomponent Na+:H+ antiporter subunit C
METALALAVGMFFAAAIYLILSKRLVRVLLGISILSNGVNLLLFTAGRLTMAVPPILSEGGTAATAANPLPQALILTAIVISFSMFAFLLVLTLRAFQTLRTDDVEEMHVAEPARPRLPPLGY